MSDTNDTSPSPLPSLSPKGKPGRKPALPVTDRIAALKAELAKAEAEAEAHQKEVAAIVGLVVIQGMQEDADLQKTIQGLLRAKVRSPRDKATIAALLI